MNERWLPSVYRDADDAGLAFALDSDGHHQLIDVCGEIAGAAPFVPEVTTDSLAARPAARKNVNSANHAESEPISFWSSCFGDEASGTLRDRERLALRLASMRALLDLLNES